MVYPPNNRNVIVYMFVDVRNVIFAMFRNPAMCIFVTK